MLFLDFDPDPAGYLQVDYSLQSLTAPLKFSTRQVQGTNSTLSYAAYSQQEHIVVMLLSSLKKLCTYF